MTDPLSLRCCGPRRPQTSHRPSLLEAAAVDDDDAAGVTARVCLHPQGPGPPNWDLNGGTDATAGCRGCGRLWKLPTLGRRTVVLRERPAHVDEHVGHLRHARDGVGIRIEGGREVA